MAIKKWLYVPLTIKKARMPQNPRTKPESLLNAQQCTNLIVVVVSLLLGVAISEGLVRVFFPQEIRGQIYEYAPRGYKVLRSSGTAAISNNTERFSIHFTPPHLRGAPAPRGSKKILVLGDSFTEGLHLPESATFIRRLQKRLDSSFGAGSFSLLNAGIGGAGTADHLAFLEDFGEELAPFAVLVYVSIDDFGRAARSGLYRLRAESSLELDAGTLTKNRIVAAVITSRIYQILADRSQFLQLVRRVLSQKFPTLAFSNAPGDDLSKPLTLGSYSTVTPDQKRLARAMFHRMKIWCDMRGVKLAIINNGWRPYDWLSELLKSEGIPFYDAAPVVQPNLKQSLSSFIIANDGHPNAKGSRLIASATWPFLLEVVATHRFDTPN